MPRLGRSRPFPPLIRRLAIVPAAGLTIAITAPVANQFRWRGTSGSAVITVSGTYTGTPTTIEVTSDGSTWTTLAASPSGGTYTGEVTLSTGQYTLSVRFSNDNSVTASVTPISVAYVFATAGQSQWGRGTSNQTNLFDPNGYTHAQKTATGYAALADPVGVTVDAGTAGTPIPPMVSALAQVLGGPIGIVAAAQGGTSITQWQSGQSAYTYLTSAALAVGGCNAVLFWQGETDAQNGMSTATYHTDLAAFVASVQSVLACPVLAALLEAQDPGAVTLANRNLICAAIVQGYADITGLKPGPDFRPMSTMPEDALHFKPDQKLDVAGGMWAAVIFKQLFQTGTALSRIFTGY